MISATLSLGDQSCSKGVFNFGGVNYRKISVTNGNVRTETSCVGPFDGLATPEDIETSVSKWGLTWNFDASSNGIDVEGPNTTGLTWNNANSVKYNVALSSLASNYNSVAFTVQIDGKYSTYVLKCVNRDNLIGVFNAYGVNTDNNEVTSVSVNVAHDASCDVVPGEENNEDVFDCINDLLERVNTLEKENSECKEKNSAYASKVNVLEDTISHLKDNIADLHSEINKKSDSDEVCQKKLEEATHNNQNLTTSLSECETKRSSLQADVDRLNTELKSCVDLKESWIKQYNEVNGKLTTCLEEKRDCKAENSALENDLVACNKLVDDRDKLIEELRAAIDTCTHDADQALRDLLNACESRVESLETDNQNLNDTISDLSYALDECLNDEENVQDSNIPLRNCLKDLADRNDTISGLNKTINNLESEIIKLERELAACNSSLSSCNSNLSTCEENYNDCQDDRSELKSENTSLISSINCRDTNIGNFGSSINALIDSLTEGCEVEDFQS